MDRPLRDSGPVLTGCHEDVLGQPLEKRFRIARETQAAAMGVLYLRIAELRKATSEFCDVSFPEVIQLRRAASDRR